MNFFYNLQASINISQACLFLFQIDLSSVSAVNSDDDDLLLHRSARDVMSDEHMDLSKTRIEEPLVIYFDIKCWLILPFVHR